MKKTVFSICENKDADQLRGNREADQRLCFRYIDSTIPLLSKSGISSLWPSSVAVQPGLCRTWSETPKTGFFTTRLKYRPCIVSTSCTGSHIESSMQNETDLTKKKKKMTTYTDFVASHVYWNYRIDGQLATDLGNIKAYQTFSVTQTES